MQKVVSVTCKGLSSNGMMHLGESVSAVFPSLMDSISEMLQ